MPNKIRSVVINSRRDQIFFQYNQPYTLNFSSSVSARDSPYISDPRAAIRAYATQTPAYTLMEPQRHTQNYHQKYAYSSTNSPRKSDEEGTKFARELRDQGNISMSYSS